MYLLSKQYLLPFDTRNWIIAIEQPIHLSWGWIQC